MAPDDYYESNGYKNSSNNDVNTSTKFDAATTITIQERQYGLIKYTITCGSTTIDRSKTTVTTEPKITINNTITTISSDGTKFYSAYMLAIYL